MPRYILGIEGMHCAGCAEAVERAIKSVNGVRDAKVNFATERALIEVDKTVNFRSLAEAVERIGYRLRTNSITLALEKTLSDEAVQMLWALNGVLYIEQTKPKVVHLKGTLTVRFVDGVISCYELIRHLQSLGYQVQLIESMAAKALDEVHLSAIRAFVGLFTSLVIMTLMMLPQFANQWFTRWTAFVLATFVVSFVGTPFFPPRNKCCP